MPEALDALILREGNDDKHSGMPIAIFTGTGADPRPRLRVDAAQTSFFEGREFRSFYEFSIPTGQTVAMRFTATQDFILHEQHFEIDAGGIRFSAALGGTPGGVFTDRPIIGKNRMSTRPTPDYVATSLFATGGTHTGGTEVEVVRVVAATATAQTSTVGGAVSSERGLPAGTYYLRLQNLSNGTTTGVYSLWWEEVMPKSERLY